MKRAGRRTLCCLLPLESGKYPRSRRWSPLRSPQAFGDALAPWGEPSLIVAFPLLLRLALLRSTPCSSSSSAPALKPLFLLPLLHQTKPVGSFRFCAPSPLLLALLHSNPSSSGVYVALQFLFSFFLGSVYAFFCSELVYHNVWCDSKNLCHKLEHIIHVRCDELTIGFTKKDWAH